MRLGEHRRGPDRHAVVQRHELDAGEAGREHRHRLRGGVPDLVQHDAGDAGGDLDGEGGRVPRVVFGRKRKAYDPPRDAVRFQ